MGSVPFERVRSFFLEARSLPPDRRAAYLDSACADDPLMRQEVEELLIADADSRTFSPGAAPRLQLGALQPAVAGYEIVGRLGEGGMGVVWAAIQQSTHRRVALKIMSESAFGSTRRQGRFIREVEVAASLQHPNIARVYDSGLDRGVYYYVMELVEGEPLDLFVNSRKLDQRRILDLMLLVCHAMQYAHQRGIIHRDLKPSNILVDKDGQPHILDFGLAKFLDSDMELSLSIDGEVAGTPMYMSPEQAAGKSELVDTRSDVYALGVLLYRLLTGDAPHGQSATYVEMIRRVAEQEVRRPRAVAPGIDRELETILLKALAHEPDERYSSAGELGEDIRRFLAQEPINARATSLTYVLRKRLRKHRVAAIATGAALVILVGMAVAAYVRVSMERTLEQAATNEAVAARTLESQQRQIAEQRGRELREHLYLAQMSLAGEASILPTGISQVSQTLSNWRSGRPDLRGWEWYYLDGLCHADLVTLRGHSGPVLGVAWRADGRRVASAGNDGFIKIWDAVSGREILSFDAGVGPIHAFAWTGDGALLAASGVDGIIKIFESEAGDLVASFDSHRGLVNALKWSPDRTRLAVGGADQVAMIVDAKSGQTLHTLVGHKHPVKAVAWSPDGRQLATTAPGASGNADKEKTRIWDADTGAPMLIIDEDGQALDWSPNGKTLLRGGDDWNIVAHDVTDRRKLFDQSQGGHVMSVTWSADGTMLASAGLSDWTVRIWDFNRARLAFTLRGHLGQINCVSWSPLGTALASASDDGTIKIWEAPPGKIIHEQPLVLRGHGERDDGGGSNWVEAIAWCPDGSMLASSARDGLVKLWNPVDGRELATLGGNGGWVYALNWSPDGSRLASAGVDRIIRIWDVSAQKVVATLEGNVDEIRAVSFNPDGTRLVSSGNDPILRVWDLKTGRQQFQLPGHTASVFTVAWSPDGRRIASGSSDRTLRIWDAETGRQQCVLEGHTNWIQSVRWSSDSRRLASGSIDQTIRIWDAVEGRELKTLRGHTDQIRSVAWSPDGTRLASASLDNTVKIWDTASGELAMTLSEGAFSMGAVAFSSDGMRLAAAGRLGRLVIHDATSGYRVEESPALLPAIDRALKTSSIDPHNLAIRAQAEVRLGDWDQAAAKARAYLAADPEARWFQAGCWAVSAGVDGSSDAEVQTDPAKPIGSSDAASEASSQVFWESVACDINGYPDVTRLLPTGRDGSIYVQVRVYSMSAQRTGLVVAPDESRVWVNGKLLPAGPTSPALPIALEPGWNTIVARMLCQHIEGAPLPRIVLRPI